MDAENQLQEKVPTMDLQIVEKGQSFQLDVATKAAHDYYFGAGWDNPNGPVDLDICCALLTNGKLAAKSDFVYYQNRTAPGVQLSEDNRTGDGDGDDENIVIRLGDVAPTVTSIIVGLAAYAGADLTNAPNAHFRVCEGTEEASPQLADVPFGTATADATVLIALQLDRTGDGWKLTNRGEFSAHGGGTGAINGFATAAQTAQEVTTA